MFVFFWMGDDIFILHRPGVQYILHFFSLFGLSFADIWEAHPCKRQLKKG